MVESGGLLGAQPEDNHARPASRRAYFAFAIIAASICVVAVAVLDAKSDFSVRPRSTDRFRWAFRYSALNLLVQICFRS